MPRANYKTLDEIRKALASPGNGADLLRTVLPAAVETLVAEQEKTNERLAALEKLANAPKPVTVKGKP
jgi:hypothetical protein